VGRRNVGDKEVVPMEIKEEIAREVEAYTRQLNYLAERKEL